MCRQASRRNSDSNSSVSPENEMLRPLEAALSPEGAASAGGDGGDGVDEGSETVNTPPSTAEGIWNMRVANTPGDSSLSLPSLRNKTKVH